MEQSDADTEPHTGHTPDHLLHHAHSQTFCLLSIPPQEATGESPPPTREHNKVGGSHGQTGASMKRWGHLQDDSERRFQNGSCAPGEDSRSNVAHEKGPRKAAAPAQRHWTTFLKWFTSVWCAPPKRRSQSRKTYTSDTTNTKLNSGERPKDESKGTSRGNTTGKGARSNQFRKEEKRDLQEIVSQKENVKSVCDWPCGRFTKRLSESMGKISSRHKKN